MNQNTIKKRIGLGLRRFLEADQLSRKYQPYFGCNAEFLRRFLEFQFNGRMSWDNFGTVWKIGHVLPLREFDQTKEEDLKLCWNWINLRPVRETSSRNAYSGVEALRILEWREKFFKDNPVIGELMRRAAIVSDGEARSFVDWGMFSVEH